jgi:hypothetical protein
MKITANGGGAVAEQGPRLSLIRTPDQRLQVFVSSSLQELAKRSVEPLGRADPHVEQGRQP